MTEFAPSLILAELLINEGVFTDPTALGSWPIFSGFMADDPDDAAALYDTQGLGDGRLMETGENIVHFAVQLRVRAHNYPDGWKKLNEARAFLETVKRSLVSYDAQTYRVDNLSQESPPFFLGHEQEGTQRRNLFTINYLATLKET